RCDRSGRSDCPTADHRGPECRWRAALRDSISTPPMPVRMLTVLTATHGQTAPLLASCQSRFAHVSRRGTAVCTDSNITWLQWAGSQLAISRRGAEVTPRNGIEWLFGAVFFTQRFHQPAHRLTHLLRQLAGHGGGRPQQVGETARGLAQLLRLAIGALFV